MCMNYTILLVLSQDEYSLLVENWNTQRGQALAHALLKVLYPQLEKELRMTLIQEGREAVLHVSCCERCKRNARKGWGAVCGLQERGEEIVCT